MRWRETSALLRCAGTSRRMPTPPAALETPAHQDAPRVLDQLLRRGVGGRFTGGFRTCRAAAATRISDGTDGQEHDGIAESEAYGRQQVLGQRRIGPVRIEPGLLRAASRDGSHDRAAHPSLVAIRVA